MTAPLARKSAGPLEHLARWGPGSLGPVAWSPDGTHLAVACGARIEVYNAETLARVRRFDTGALVLAVAYAPDGASLAASDKDGWVWAYRTNDGERVCALAHDDAVTDLAYSPDGTRLVVRANRAVTVYRASDGAKLRTLRGTIRTPVTSALAPDNVLVGQRGRGFLSTWDLTTGDIPATLPKGPRAAQVALAPSGTAVVVTTPRRIVWIRWPEGTERWHAQHDDDVVGCIAISPAGDRVAVAGHGVTVYSADDGAPLVGPLAQDRWTSSVAFSPDGHTLASSAKDQIVRLWHGTVPAGTLGGFTGVIKSLAFSADGTTLVVVPSVGPIRVLRAADGVERWRHHGRNGDGFRVAGLSGDGTTLAAVGATVPPLLHFLSLADGQETHAPCDVPYGVRCLAVAPDGRRVALGTEWDLRLRPGTGAANQLILSAPGAPIDMVAYSPDGEYLAALAQDGAVGLWRADDGAPLVGGKWAAPGLSQLAFTPDGRYVVVTDGTQATLRRVRDGGVERSLARDLHGHTACLFDQVGDVLILAAVGSVWRSTFDRVADQWSLAQPLATGPGFGWTAIALSPDGSLLACGDGDGTVHVWGVRASMP